MIHVLKHVESITQHRDRALLELGVASALFELVKAREVNLHKIVGEGDARALEQVTHVGTDGVRYATEAEIDDSQPIGRGTVQALKGENGKGHFSLPGMYFMV